jgi:hypothetical protein
VTQPDVTGPDVTGPDVTGPDVTGPAAIEPRVVVLQSVQPLTVDHTDLGIVVLSDRPSGPVLREDVPGPEPEVLRVPREEWADAVRRLAGDLADDRGADVVTNDEYCLTACRDLRAALGLPARHPAGLEGYLDKTVMKSRLAAAGVGTPRFRTLAPVAGADRAALAGELAAELGLPLVVKPRQQANSRGVEVLPDVAAVTAWLDRHDREAGGEAGWEAGWEAEEYLAGPQFHVNGLVRDGEVTPVMAGRYLGPLLGLEHGRRLGGVSLPPDDPLVPAAHDLNRAVAAALGADGAFVIHTEFCVGPGGRLVVLETAARAPGAMLPAVSWRHAGVDLERANLALQLGRPLPEPGDTGWLAGWVWVPVMPGERLTRPPTFRCASDVHLRELARTGNRGRTGGIGASVTLWSRDVVELDADLELAAADDWGAAPLAAP